MAIFLGIVALVLCVIAVVTPPALIAGLFLSRKELKNMQSHDASQ